MVATEPRPELSLRSPEGRLALVATVAASAMASLDATVVNVALPHIAGDFDASISSLQWVLTGYLLSLASLILLGGALGDRLGRRRIFVVGTAWFAVASLLCGVAPNSGVLIAARILQGVGGALLTPGSLAILQASFRESDRAAAVGAWSGLGGIAGAIGPLVGGALVDGPGWRWAFLINLPVAAAAVACAMAAVPESRDPHATRRLDFRGATLGVVGLATGTWALIEAGERGWGSAGVLVPAAIAVAATAAFARHTARTRDGLVPPALFRDRTFTVVNLGTVLLYAAIGVAFFLVAFELQVAAGWSALRSGLALLPTTVLMLVLSSRSGALAQRIGPRLQLGVGPVVAGIGLVALTMIGPSTSWVTDVLPGSLLFGLGLVIFVAPLTATVMASAHRDHVSVASGVNNAVARAAGLIALAVVPAATGFSSAASPGELTDAFRMSLVVVGVLAAAAGPLMLLGLPRRARCARTARPLHCAIDGPPLQPDPDQCPVGSARR